MIKFMLVPMAVALIGAAHPAEVESQLAFLAGDWTIAGRDGYRDHCTWFENKSFIVCDTTDGRPGGHHSVAIIGWSAEERYFTYQQYDSSGRSRNERCFANAQRGITCLGSSRTAKGLTETRSHIWPTPTGLGIRQERSVDAGPWAEVGRVDYVRRAK